MRFNLEAMLSQMQKFEIEALSEVQVV